MTIANELRDQVEIFQTLEYPRFLSTLIPVFLDILQNGSPVFVSNSHEQVILLYACLTLECNMYPFFQETTQHHSRDYISTTTNRATEGIRSRPMQDFDEPATSGE